MVRMATQVLNLTDDLLASILILLSLTDLGRACTACATFRRIITSPSFLQHLHELHPPSLLGLRSFFGRFQPVESPHPSAVVARALARAADFRFSFLPNPGMWIVRDARDGRFVLDLDEGTDGTFPRIAVCDPLFWRCVLLPPIPEDLAAAVEQPIDSGEFNHRKSHVFLAPCGEEVTTTATTGQSSQSFKVIWMAQCPAKLVAFVFASASRQWRAITSTSWSELDPGMCASVETPCLFHRSYAYGCFYWSISILSNVVSKLLVLDMIRLEFSSIGSLPASASEFGQIRMVELGESRRGMFLFDNYYTSPRILQLFCANGQNHGEGASQWVLEKEVTLPYPSCTYRMIGDADGTLLVQGRRVENRNWKKEFCCMSFDFKTLQHQDVLETLVGGLGAGALPPVLYTGYPPSLSLPTI